MSDKQEDGDQSGGSQSTVPRPAATTSPGNVNSWAPPGPAASEALGRAAARFWVVLMQLECENMGIKAEDSCEGQKAARAQGAGRAPYSCWVLVRGLWREKEQGQPRGEISGARMGDGAWSGRRTRLPVTLPSSPAMTSPSSSSLTPPSWETLSSSPVSLRPATSCPTRRPATSAAGAVSTVRADPSSRPQGQWAGGQDPGAQVEGNTRTGPYKFFAFLLQQQPPPCPQPLKHKYVQLNTV